jgi:hypothetical protein
LTALKSGKEGQEKRKRAEEEYQKRKQTSATTMVDI